MFAPGDLVRVVSPSSLGIVPTRDPFNPVSWGTISTRTLVMIISERWSGIELGPSWTHVVLDPVNNRLCLVQGDCLVPEV